MRFIDRILGRRNEPEDEPAPNPHETDDGKAIKRLWRSEWHSDDYGLREDRHHVGQSEYGFHGGLEISVGGGEGPFKWGLARPTKADAEMSAYGMREGWELHQSWQEHKQHAEWETDHIMARERKETGKEPACRPLEIDSLHPNDAADYVLTSRDLTEQDRKDQATVQRLWDRKIGIDR